MKTFPLGGVHPKENKLTQMLPIEIMGIPNSVIVPLNQNLGAPNEALVKIKDEVLAGQKIGDSKAFVSAPVHATISGKIKKIERFYHPCAKRLIGVEITSDGDNKQIESILETEDVNYKELLGNTAEILSLVKEAGIVGMGGATFPTHVKLNPPKDKKIDTILLNGVECEPYLTADHRVMLESPDKILKGFEIILSLFPNAKGIIGIEGNKNDAYKLLKKKAENYKTIEVIKLKVKYPQGGEKQLIKSVLQREVPPGKLPFDIGVLVQNVQSALSIYEAVTLKKPVIDRVITISGDAIKEKKNILVRIGTKLTDIIEFCGGTKENLKKVIFGGPMMGQAITNLDIPIIKGTSGILFLSDKETKVYEESRCLRCGFCVDACPQGLVPADFISYVKNADFETLENMHILDCIECGCCVFACPSKRKMVHYIKLGKMEINARKKDK
ncbi:MAG: electron transport complex subunit RsxC [Pseudomonadota bacterium]